MDMPDGLDAGGQSFWSEITGTYVLNPAEQRILKRACRTVDLLDGIDSWLASHGDLLVESGAQLKAHPLLSIKAEQERTLELLVRGLALPMVNEQAGRRRNPLQKAAAEARWAKREAGPVGRVEAQ